MAYELIPAVETPGSEAPAMIRFYYTTNNIFSEVHQETSYRSKYVKDAEGKSQYNDILITLQEISKVTTSIKRSIHDIFIGMYKFVPEGLANPYFINEEITLVDTSGVTASGALVEDNSQYIRNLIPNIDNQIELAIINYVLFEWYKTVGLTQDAEYSRSIYNSLLVQINNLTFQLRKKVA
jgi:hypothetical protein